MQTSTGFTLYRTLKAFLFTLDSHVSTYKAHRLRSLVRSQARKICMLQGYRKRSQGIVREAREGCVRGLGGWSDERSDG